jgi:1-acyl-sn-glycerol-3-phosphate acyltransferase
MTVLRSLLFNAAFFLWTGLWCLMLVWTLILPRWVMMALIGVYLRTLAWLERHLIGLTFRVEGAEHLPAGAFIVAAKHQSTWETMKLHLLLDDPAVVLKRELMMIPFWGWLARKARMIAVDRGGGSRVVASMIEGARAVAAEGRPIVIFPQGTRVAPGAFRPYRIGVAALYEALSLPIVPMALNSGVFWPRRSFLKRPGTITVRFLPPIAPGLGREAALKRLEGELEAETDRLVVAAGGPASTHAAGGAPAPGVEAAG